MIPRTTILAAVPFAALAPAAHAQSIEIAWRTIDCGGGQISGSSLSIASTSGQHDAGSIASATLAIAGGYWTDLSPCPADFNLDGTVDTRDVLAFLNAWTARDPRSDYNADGAIDTRDVLAFLNAWTAGCE